MSYLRKRGLAIGYAVAGLRAALNQEEHLRMHVFISVIVIFLGCYFSLSATEWFMILSCITLVICLEMINSALEKLCDLVNPEQHPGIKYIKDVAAGAVFFSCLLAITIGVMVFFKYLA